MDFAYQFPMVMVIVLLCDVIRILFIYIKSIKGDFILFQYIRLPNGALFGK